MISLNGVWETGLERNYVMKSNVPGLVYSACTPTEGSVWYRKDVRLPDGDWQRATLILYGARYMPKVYVNGTLVSSAAGGLTVTRHFLDSSDVCPGNTVTVEIELTSFNDTPDTDASKLPEADEWRSDLSSHIWNDVYLDLHNDTRIDSVITSYDEKDNLIIKYKTTSFADCVGEKITFTLYDGTTQIASGNAEVAENGMCVIPLCGKCKLWSPDEPNLYTLKTEVSGAISEQRVGIKIFKKKDLGLELNGEPVTLRMGSVCWHRWLRDEQAIEIAFDEKWFLRHILLPLKQSGANTVRFHLGPPPEKFIDLCDEYGMFYQAEWSFFHELSVGVESLKEQWPNWLDMTLRHVSVSVVHPWNEITEPEKLVAISSTLETIIKDYPEFVLAHRDVMHLHKYWWSLFENVGVYYDNKEQFGMPVISDEFGGNYLDYSYNMGDYPTIIPSFLRFLGENHSVEDRIWLQNVAHSKMAEYWRRLDVAGFSPFCMLSSPDDGNTYFEGDLKDGKFKPVFEKLKAAYSPVSVSMNVWDRNYFSNQETTVELYLFNDTSKSQNITCFYGIKGESPQGKIEKTLEPHTKQIVSVTYKMPKENGEYIMYAQVGDVVSEWDIIITNIDASEINKKVGLLECETELIEFLRKYNIAYTNNLSDADIFVGLKKTYDYLKTEENAKAMVESLLNNGKNVALLSVGPQPLGEGYEEISCKRLMSALPYVNNTKSEKVNVAFDIDVMFAAVKEPESCVQITDNMNSIWENINRKSLWLWNGLKGGLIVPAADMIVVSTDRKSFEKLWNSRGADIDFIRKGNYYAYELEGNYEYSTEKDAETEKKLRDRVRTLVNDAPAIYKPEDAEKEIKIFNLYEEYIQLPESTENINYIQVCKAGKELLRLPAVMLEFEGKKSRLFISQIMFDGRLLNENEGLFCLKNDPVASQMLLNIIKSI